jgi:hypothetical protein
MRNRSKEVSSDGVGQFGYTPYSKRGINLPRSLTSLGMASVDFLRDCHKWPQNGKDCWP